MTTAKLRVEPSFYVFWALFCLLDSEGVLPLFVCAAVIHEMGHVLAIGACGGRIDGVVLSAAGAVIRQSRSLSPPAECLIAAAGPLAGAAAAGILSALHCPMAAGANVLLSLVNSLPLLPLDGGCALRSLLGLLPAAAMTAGLRALELASLLGAAVLTLLGGALLLYTGRNAAGLAVGLFLLGANARLLRGSGNYGMIQSIIPKIRSN